MHPVESILHAATVDGSEHELAIAGEGAPLVAEFCVAELALALGMSTDAGKRYLGDAVETRYRLPAPLDAGLSRVRSRSGRPARSRTRTIVLSADAAGFVDQHIAPIAHTVLLRADRPVRRRSPRPLRPRRSRSEAGRSRRAPPRRHPPQRRHHRRAGLHRGHHRPRRRPRLRSRPSPPRPTTSSTSSHDLSLDVRRPWPSATSATVTASGWSRELVIHTHHDTSSPRRARPRRQHQVLDHHRTTQRVVPARPTPGSPSARCSTSTSTCTPTGTSRPRGCTEQVIQTHPDLRLPPLRTTIAVLRPRPHHRMARRPDRLPESRTPRAEATTGSRPTAAGPTNALGPPRFDWRSPLGLTHLRRS